MLGGGGGAGGEDGNLFGWLREITRGFTSLQSNFRDGVWSCGDPESRRGSRGGREGAAAWRRAQGGNVGVWRGGLGSRRTALGAPLPGLRRWGLGRGVPGKARAAVQGARRAEAGRGAAERGPAGRGDARGARRACAGVGACPEKGRGAPSPQRLTELGRGAAGTRDAAEVWESEKDRVPGEEKCAGEKRDLLEQAGVSASRSRPNSAAAAGELFWETCCFPNIWGPQLPRRRAGWWSWGAQRGVV